MKQGLTGKQSIEVEADPQDGEAHDDAGKKLHYLDGMQTALNWLIELEVQGLVEAVLHMGGAETPELVATDCEGHNQLRLY